MLPTTWFYLSSLLILAVFFRFNRLFSVRNFDVLALTSFTPGLIYLAMGATFQGYLWLWIFGMALFARLILDLFLRRRPLLEPNLNFSGLIFSCAASCAFIIPNLFINRGDACESPRAWRLEQIIAASEEYDGSFNVKNWPGFRPFLLASKRVENFFAPSLESWRRAVSDTRDNRETHTIDFFGLTIELGEATQSSRRPAKRAVQWAAGMTEGPAFDFETDERDVYTSSSSPRILNGLRSAPAVPVASIAPRADDLNASGSFGTVVPDVSSNAWSFADTELNSEPTGGAPNATHSPELHSPSKSRSLNSSETLLILLTSALQIGAVATIVLIGRNHFGSLRTGVACGLLYLLLPYINQFSARLDHIVPCLAILLAVLFYRRPVLSGIAIGVAGALVFYPFFLVPIWLGFYWKKGVARFALGLSGIVLTLGVAMLFLYSPECGDYEQALRSMFGRRALFLAEADGLWEYLPRFYRIPLIALFGVFCFGFPIWIPRKNLATLLACSGALMLGVQFWMGRQGGLYMSWYLPLVILTFFRPNLDDRTALTVVDAPA